MFGTQSEDLWIRASFCNSTIRNLYDILQSCLSYENMSLRLPDSVIYFLILWFDEARSKHLWSVNFVPGTVLDSLQMLLHLLIQSRGG